MITVAEESNEVTVIESFETRVSNIYWRSDGILKIVLKDKTHVELADSKEIFSIVKKLSSGKKDMLVYTIAGEDVTTDKEVREFSSSEECSRYTLGEAVVLKSLAHRILINFYLNINKPNRHIKMFTSENEAIKWLKSLKSE